MIMLGLLVCLFICHAYQLSNKYVGVFTFLYTLNLIFIYQNLYVMFISYECDFRCVNFSGSSVVMSPTDFPCHYHPTCAPYSYFIHPPSTPYSLIN